VVSRERTWFPRPVAQPSRATGRPFGTKYDNIDQNKAKKEGHGGARGQTGSRNMAATRFFDSATPTSYLTSNTSRGAHTIFSRGGHRRLKRSVVGGRHHGECGARAYNGGLGAPEAESILVIECLTEPANLAPFQKCICISTLGATVMI